jgi:hypothetical protein
MRAMFCSRTSRSLVAIAIAFTSACADYEDPAQPDELGPGESTQNGDEASTDNTAVSPINQATPDAGSVNAPDASVRAQEDASGPVLLPDGGGVAPNDAGNGRADAGVRDRDASAPVDASTQVDASSTVACGTLAYANFGMQFMATYCVGCHSGAGAKHGVQLDTLAGVQKNKTAVKRQTVTGTTMPSVDPKPSAADRQKLGQWLDCGPS